MTGSQVLIRQLFLLLEILQEPNHFNNDNQLFFFKKKRKKHNNNPTSSKPLIATTKPLRKHLLRLRYKYLLPHSLTDVLGQDMFIDIKKALVAAALIAYVAARSRTMEYTYRTFGVPRTATIEFNKGYVMGYFLKENPNKVTWTHGLNGNEELVFSDGRYELDRFRPALHRRERLEQLPWSIPKGASMVTVMMATDQPEESRGPEKSRGRRRRPHRAA